MRKSADVRRVFLGFVDVFNDGDLDAVVATFASSDAILVTGTHAGEWAEGREAVEALFLAEMAEIGPFRLVADDLRAWEQGDVGWLAAQGRYVGGEEGEVPVRVTGVATRDEGVWKIVQLHAHIVPDE